MKILLEAKSVITSVITALELTAAVERAKRESKLLSPDYRKMVATMDEDLRTGVIGLITLDSPILSLAKELIKRRRLRVQDSIQLASAVKAHKKAPGSLRFVCSDHALLEAARLEGLQIVDPSAS